MSYSDSLRQHAKWVREALDPEADPLQKITLDDIDVEELEGAAGHIDALVEALTDLIEAICRDSDEGGKGISGYTAARVSDARDAISPVGGKITP